MAFIDDEISATASAPIEGYEFVGSATTWRYTSAIESVTIDGNAYTPLAGLIRTAFKQGTTVDTPTLEVTLPSSTQLVSHYGFTTPPRSLSLTVYRYQPNGDDFAIVWQGEVTALSPAGLMTRLTCPSLLGARLGCTVPSLTVRLHCNKRLGSVHCGVDLSAFDFGTLVAGVSSDGLTISLAGIGGNPLDWFRSGTITRDSDGESRVIIKQTSVIATVTLHAPFRELNNGDAVTLVAGCMHVPSVCESKFANLVNFGGFPTLPDFNPFLRPITLGGA